MKAYSLSNGYDRDSLARVGHSSYQHIVTIFKEVMKAMDLIDHTAQQRNSSERGQNSRTKRVIL